MAQQFKRKFAPKDPAPGEDEESFVKIGTPLPPLTSTKADQNVFLPIWKQEVTDEQGRRRLHGAFTGGFSAGYFNTVGSKEGWNPTEFKSSRTDKKSEQKGFSQKPEDFMDEEDLAELVQSRDLHANSNFGSTPTNTAHLPRNTYDPLAGTIGSESGSDFLGVPSLRPSALDIALLESVQPSNVRAGQRIMENMGWRDGQGIGPRVTHKRRVSLALKLGIDLSSQHNLEHDPELTKHLYAPIDRPVTQIQPWLGNSGLGHSQPAPACNLDAPFSSSTYPSTGVKHQGPKIPTGPSFGLGALNDTEDDDHDVYAAALDQVTSDPRARRLLKISEGNTSSHNPLGCQSAKTTNWLPTAGKKVFQDNTHLPTGFRLSDTPTKEPAPASCVPQPVPKTWKPCPTRVWEAAKSHSQPLGVQHRSRQSTCPINAHDRAQLIGEKAPPVSIFDFISAKDKARLEEVKQLAQASLHSKNLKHKGDREGVAPGKSVTIPLLDPSIAQAALRGFMPFLHDLPKQGRYKLYLQSQAGMLPKGTQFSPKVAPQMSVEVINKELDGFVKSAMMFKPMSAIMASRFTSAASSSTSGELAAPEPGLRQPVFLEEAPEGTSRQEKESKESKEKEIVSDAAQAVRMDMFGMLTRSIKKFYPQKLLCKRFNVPQPFPDGPPAEPPPKATSNNLSEFLSSQGFQPAVTPVRTDTNKEKSADSLWCQSEANQDAPQPVEKVGLGSDETQGRDILTTPRPPIDLFKAIFAGDNDNEGSNDDVADDLEHMASPQVQAKQDSGPSFLVPAIRQVVSLTPVVVSLKAVENLASFRPTFLKKDLPTHEPVSSKKPGKKKKRPVLISFDDEQADGLVDCSAEPQKKKQKKQPSKAQDKPHQVSLAGPAYPQVQDSMNKPDEDEWVEAVAPILPPPKPKKPLVNQSTSSSTAYKKVVRMKASDMMD